MITNHLSVEKIGGTSMSRFEELIDNLFIGDRTGYAIFNRVFVVSAYSGITDALLEHKKSGEPGVYASFANASEKDAWQSKLNEVKCLMQSINRQLLGANPLLVRKADQFVSQRITDAENALNSLQALTSYGHFTRTDHLPKVREMLASLGEAHSAYNSVLRLNAEGINSCFIDLTGWQDESSSLTLDERLQQQFKGLDLTQCLPIVTGYARCRDGLMAKFDRGYSEMTFSRLASVLGAQEAIIHKEYHLSSADPRLVGEKRVIPIGRTNYDVADQLSNLGMEAIHPKAAKGLRQSGIDLRIKNAFEPEHPGTLITLDYASPKPCVEIVAGREKLTGIEIFDQQILGDWRYETRILELLGELKLEMVSRQSDANSRTYYVDGSRKMVNRAVRLLGQTFPEAKISLHSLSLISVIGSDLKVAGILAQTATSLAKADISVLAIQQSVRQVELQCLVATKDYKKAITSLHRDLIESQGHSEMIAAA